MKAIKSNLLIALFLVGGWFAAALLCWPILIALRTLAAALLIPHAAGTYRSLGIVQSAHLSDFPLNFWTILLIPLMAMPLGLFILFWWFVCLTIIWETYKDIRAVRGNGRTNRTRKRRGTILRAMKALLITSVIFLVLCTPFLRRYEIVTDQFIYVRHFFDLRERAYPIASLRSIDSNYVRAGLVIWDFTFSSGDGFSIAAPDMDMNVLEQLLSKPGVSSSRR